MVIPSSKIQYPGDINSPRLVAVRSFPGVVVAISELLAFYVLKLDWFRHAALLQESCLGEEFSRKRVGGRMLGLAVGIHC